MTDIKGLSPAKRALLERALRKRREAAAATPTIPRRSESGPAPLSYSQQRMWFLQRWEPEAPTWNGARAIRLRGSLDRAALERGLRAIVQRHEGLRTVVSGESEPEQAVLDRWSFELPVLRIEPGADAEPQLRSLLRQLSREPFDLAADLMLRGTLIELGATEHVLLLRMHHIAADAQSDQVLFAELSEFYNASRAGREPALPELPIQYADFAVWQRQHLQGPALAKLVSYWATHLEDAPPLLSLPTDRPRPPIQRHAGSHYDVAFDRALAERLEALARQQGVTFFMMMLAAFATLLYRWSGEDDIVIGSPIANRSDIELAGLIGFFTNTIALRIRLTGSPSFREVLARARETALGAYAHQDLPFEKLVETLRPKRDPGYNPIVQVSFRAHEARPPALALAGITTEPVTIDIGFSRFDLALELELRQTGVAGYLEYDHDLFDEPTIVGLAADLGAVLEQVAADPDAPILAIALPQAGARAAGARSARKISRRLPK